MKGEEAQGEKEVEKAEKKELLSVLFQREKIMLN